MKKVATLSLLFLIFFGYVTTPFFGATISHAESEIDRENIWYIEEIGEIDITGEWLVLNGTNLNGEEKNAYVAVNRWFSLNPIITIRTSLYWNLKRIEPGLPAYLQVETEYSLSAGKRVVKNIRVVDVTYVNGELTIDTSGGIFKERLLEFYSDPNNTPSMGERTFADILIATANFLMRVLSMQDVTLLVFGKNPHPTDDGFMQGECAVFDCREGEYLGVLSEGMIRAVDALYTTFERFLPYPIFIVTILIGFAYLRQSISLEGRTKGKDYMMGLIIALIAIRFGHFLWMLAAWITSTFTDLIWHTMIEYGIQTDLFLNMIWGAGSAGYYDMISARGLGVGALVFVAAMMTAVLNFQYAMRTVMLMVLLVVFVPACVISIFPSRRHALTSWFEEFIANLFMPCAHAVALGLLFLLLQFSSLGVSMWIIFAYFFGLPAVVNLFRQLLGLKEESGGFGGMFGTMLGISSIVAASKIFGKKKNSNSEGIQTSEAGSSNAGSSEKSNQSENSQSGGKGASQSPSIGRKIGGAALKGAGKIASFGLRAGGVIGGATVSTMISGNPALGIAGGALVGQKASDIIGGAASTAKKGYDWLSTPQIKKQGIEVKEMDEKQYTPVVPSIVRPKGMQNMKKTELPKQHKVRPVYTSYFDLGTRSHHQNRTNTVIPVSKGKDRVVSNKKIIAEPKTSTSVSQRNLHETSTVKPVNDNRPNFDQKPNTVRIRDNNTKNIEGTGSVSPTIQNRGMRARNSEYESQKANNSLRNVTTNHDKSTQKASKTKRNPELKDKGKKSLIERYRNEDGESRP